MIDFIGLVYNLYHDLYLFIYFFILGKLSIAFPCIARVSNQLFNIQIHELQTHGQPNSDWDLSQIAYRHIDNFDGYNVQIKISLLIIIIVGVVGPGAHIYVYIGPGAQPKDIKQSGDG